jgi:hypothetical protein
MAEKPTPLLQPLRIPTGWEVEWNTFLEVEPIFEAGDDKSQGFGEDLLQVSNERNAVLLDLGWYPHCDPQGKYRLVAIRKFPDKEEMRSSWDRPLRMLESSSKEEIVREIEDWLSHFAHHTK